MRMKKFLLSLAAVMAIAFTANAKDVKEAPNPWDGTTVADGVYTFAGGWKGSATWLGSEEKPFDASANDYAYIKVSGVTGGPIRFAVQYNKFVAEQEWGKEFKQEIVLMSEDGLYGIKLDKENLGDGGKTLAEEVMQLVVQDDGKAGSLKIEEIGFCTKAEYDEMRGPEPEVPEPADVITIKSADKKKDAWDSQFWIVLDQELAGGETIEYSMDVKADIEATAGSQYHKAPGEYLHYAAIGNVAFKTSWSTYKGKATVDDAAAGAYSIAMNLNDLATANTYYFGNISIKINGKEAYKDYAYKYDQGEIVGLNAIASEASDEVAFDLFGNAGATEGLMVKGGKKVYVK